MTLRISPEFVSAHERMLNGRFLCRDSAYLRRNRGRGEGRQAVRCRVPPSHPTLQAWTCIEDLAAGREAFTTEQWKHLLLRSVGFEPASLSKRAQDILLLRMVPFVDRNYNMVELGPRGTGKSHLFQQISPSSHLISGGKATVARMFVNNATGQRGLVAQYDVVCFDEISGVSFDQKDGVNIMKGYMESVNSVEVGKAYGQTVAWSSWGTLKSMSNTSNGLDTCLNPCRLRCGMIPPSWIASMPICLAGTFRSWIGRSSQTTSA